MDKGFFGSLADFSFSSFVTPKLIKILYIITLVLLVLAYLGIAIALFTSGGETTIDPDTFETSETGSPALGILWLLIGGPLFLFFYTLLYRVLFEILIVIFRIYENTRDQLTLDRLLNPEAATRLDQMNGPQAETAVPQQPVAQSPAAPPPPPIPPSPQG